MWSRTKPQREIPKESKSPPDSKEDNKSSSQILIHPKENIHLSNMKKQPKQESNNLIVPKNPVEKKNELIKIKIKTHDKSSLGNLHIIGLEKFSTKHLISNRNDMIFQLKSFRPIMNRSKRKKLIKEYPMLSLVFKCNSKQTFINLILKMSSVFKNFVKIYLTKFFIRHLHLRQIKEITGLMAYRQTLYDAMDEPEILNTTSHSSNNLIKNFCKGLVNFVVIFYDDLIKEGIFPKPNYCDLENEQRR